MWIHCIEVLKSYLDFINANNYKSTVSWAVISFTNSDVECEFYHSLRFCLKWERFLFICSNEATEFVYVETTVCWPDKIFSIGKRWYFSKGPSTFCSSKRLLKPLQLKLCLFEITPKQEYVLLNKHNTSVHLESSLKSPSSPLSCFLCLPRNIQKKIFPAAPTVKVSVQSFLRNYSHSIFILGGIQFSSSILARARDSEFVSFPVCSSLFTSKHLFQKL